MNIKNWMHVVIEWRDWMLPFGESAFGFIDLRRQHYKIVTAQRSLHHRQPHHHATYLFMRWAMVCIFLLGVTHVPSEREIHFVSYELASGTRNFAMAIFCFATQIDARVRAINCSASSDGDESSCLNSRIRGSVKVVSTLLVFCFWHMRTIPPGSIHFLCLSVCVLHTLCVRSRVGANNNNNQTSINVWGFPSEICMRRPSHCALDGRQSTKWFI